jgi:two-component system, LytTR family, response regulator
MNEILRTIRLVVVDDEPPARDLVRQYLEGCDGYEIVAFCRDGFEAVKAVDEHSPEILLLDVQMPKLNGFEVLELLEEPPQVIFTTAHDEYALRAFEVAAVDYLLKPFEADRLIQALARARARLEVETDAPETSLPRESSDRLRQARNAEQGPAARLVARDGASVRVIPRGEIDYLEARDDYVLIHATPGTFRKKQPLGELEELLGDGFVRIHRGYLVQLDRLREIEPYAKDSRVAFLADGTRLPVSRTGYARLRELL